MRSRLDADAHSHSPGHDHGRGSGGVVGVIANPMSGRDVRRLAARARRETPEDKQNQLARAVVGAAASGADRFLLVGDCFRISKGAVENLGVPAEFEFLDVGPLETKPGDTHRAVQAMRDRGAKALLVLGGDGTNRIVAKAWPDAPIVPMSTGTNNVFPRMQEPTLAGGAAGLVASGAVALAQAATRAKIVHVTYEDGSEDLAVVDAVLLAGDHLGNLMPFEPGKLRCLVLARAEPAAVGMSPIGGLLQPSGFADDFGVEVRCTAPPASGAPASGSDASGLDAPGGTAIRSEPTAGSPAAGSSAPVGRSLLVPISPGLYRQAYVAGARKLALGEVAVIEGPGILAFDGDRTRALAVGERAEVRVERDGPWVIEAERALAAAGQEGVFSDRHWHDGFDGTSGPGCC